MSSKIEEMAREYSTEFVGVLAGATERLTDLERIAFKAGARAVLEEAEKERDDMNHDDNISLAEMVGANKLIGRMRALFAEQEAKYFGWEGK